MLSPLLLAGTLLCIIQVRRLGAEQPTVLRLCSLIRSHHMFDAHHTRHERTTAAAAARGDAAVSGHKAASSSVCPEESGSVWLLLRHNTYTHSTHIYTHMYTIHTIHIVHTYKYTIHTFIHDTHVHINTYIHTYTHSAHIQIHNTHIYTR